MKFCSKCGKEIMDEAVVCPSCGCAQANAPTATGQDSDSFGWACLGFCIPVVGLILWLIWKDNYPMKAKKAGVGALASVIVTVVIYVIYAIILGVAMSSLY